MPPQKKKPNKGGVPDAPPVVKHGEVEQSGRFYEGAVAATVIRENMRVAVWAPGADDPSDEPQVMGVLIGIVSHGIGRVPSLAVASNGRTIHVDLDAIGDIGELHSRQTQVDRLPDDTPSGASLS